ncbi:MAG: ABC transporter ATP-binding protein/permease [Bacilli bacterium]|nr:ABC transporter ATP-binding protein/permease [Bacilli bacterium]
MNLIQLKNISKRYELPNGKSFLALNNINLELPSSGFISILGKSGCGKSTLLNIIGLMDEASSGHYYFNSREITKLSHLEKEDYLSNNIGIVFQHYYLIEDKDVLFNITLPMLINGSKYEEAKEDALTLLKGINFDESLYDKKVSDLSGGEKQRVAILRALINSPNILLCDEPTGALDSENSIRVMDILKRASKNKLVLMVSHNEELVKQYSDRIIALKDGSIIDDQIINEIKGEGTPIIKDIQKHKKEKWIEQISLQNFKKRVKTNIFSIFALTISLVASILIGGFARYSNETVDNEAKKKIDYGAFTISKEEKVELEGSIVSLVQQSRPNETEITSLEDKSTFFTYTNNYDVLLPSGAEVSYIDEKLDQILIRPVYSFTDSYINPNLLIKGALPNKDSFDEILINKQAYEYIYNSSKKESLDIELTIHHEYESSFYTFDKDNSVIRDIFSLTKNLKIVGVVDELDFLSSPTIYFSYKSFINYLDSYLLNNLSTYKKKDISWKERIDGVSSNDELSSFSIRAFLNSYSENKNLKKYIEDISFDGLVATSLPLTVENSLKDLINASTTGMELFLGIALIGIVLILGIISYFSYSQDRKRSAVFSALGASRTSIMKIYLYENLLIGLFAFFFTIILSFPLTLFVNKIVARFTNINNLVRTPYYLFTHFKYDYLLLLLVAIILITVLATIIPIFFSKKISIAKELRDE